MRAFAGYLVLLLATPLAALAVILPANVYRAQGIAAPDCDGPLQVLIFALPAVLIYGAGAFVAYRARRRVHRILSLLCLIVALATFSNIAAATQELYRNAAAGDCAG